MTEKMTFDIEAYLDAFQRGDTAAMGHFLADDFGFLGPAPDPIPAEAFLGLTETFFAAFPDIDWRIETSEISVDGFVVTTQTRGTHTGVLDLTAMGSGRFEPTGGSFRLPGQQFVYEIEAGLIRKITAQPTEGAGLPGILAQLELA
ncbi:MAG: ester cyclase [Chloroflexota bacterium]